MKPKLRRPSPAMVVACLALFLAGTGTGVAVTTALPKGSVGTAQLKANAVISSKVKNRSLKAVDFATGQLPRGAKGAIGTTGATGATGAQGPSGVVTTEVTFGGDAISGGVTAWVFATHPATVTTTASQRLTGAAGAPLLSAASSGGQYFGYDLCYQPSTGGTISNFAGIYYSVSSAWPEFRTFAAAGSVVPGAGTWKVGFCVRNDRTNSMTAGYVNGWVQVTN